MTKLFARDAGPAVDVDPHGYEYGYDEFMAEFGEDRANAILEAIVEEEKLKNAALAKPPGSGYTCPKCQRTSFNPNDLKNKYCAFCNEPTGVNWI